MCLLFLNLNVNLAWATTIFEDGFESGDFSNWTTTYGSPTIVTSPVYQGSYAASFDAEGDYIEKDITDASTYYYRLYARWANDITDSGARMTIMGFFDAGGAESCYLELWNDAGTLKWRIWYQDSGNNPIWQATDTPTPTNGTWYCIELKYYMDSTNGEIRLWIDGTERLVITDDMRPTSISRIRAGISQNLYLTTNTLYVDCVVVADTYIGPEEAVTEESVSANLTIDTASVRNLILLKTVSASQVFYAVTSVQQYLEKAVSGGIQFIGTVIASVVSAIERTVSASLLIFSELQSIYIAIKSAFANFIIDTVVSRILSLSRAIGLDVVIDTIAKTGFQIYEMAANAILYIITEIGKMGGIVTTKGWVMGVMLAFGDIFLIAIVIFVFMRKVIR